MYYMGISYFACVLAHGILTWSFFIQKLLKSNKMVNCIILNTLDLLVNFVA